MPASQVLEEFRKGKLRSGSKHGPVVRKKSQARAIQISEARKEGYDIPYPRGRAKMKKSRSKKSRRRRHSKRYNRSARR